MLTAIQGEQCGNRSPSYRLAVCTQRAANCTVHQMRMLTPTLTDCDAKRMQLINVPKLNVTRIFLNIPTEHRGAVPSASPDIYRHNGPLFYYFHILCF